VACGHTIAPRRAKAVPSHRTPNYGKGKHCGVAVRRAPLPLISVSSVSSVVKKMPLPLPLTWLLEIPCWILDIGYPPLAA